MDVTISHCGSSVADTKLYLLDASQMLLEFNDDYAGPGVCTNTRLAYMKKEQLPAGTYYVVSEAIPYSSSEAAIKSQILSMPEYDNDASPYSRPVYEPSPLNRIAEQYGPGAEWYNNNKSVKKRDLTNLATGDEKLICAPHDHKYL